MAFAFLDLRSLVTYSAGTVGVGYSTESPAAEQPYVGVGLGYSYAYVYGGSCICLVPPCVDSCAPTGSGTASGLGGKVFGGVDFAPGLSVEASYEIIPPIGASNYDAASVYLKYRF